MTKTASTNYTASGTNFPLATEATDDLEDDDLFALQLAMEQHTHDSTRGLAIRRLNTSSTPSASGHVQVSGDDLRWWAAVAAAVRTAATLEGTQVWTGQQRFNQPLVLPNQATPAAPGVGLSVVYTKTDGLAYIRSGTGTERPMGSPPGVVFTAKAFDTDGTPGTWAELRQVLLAGGTYKNWVLTFDPTSTEVADFAFPVPPSYAGTPINFLIQWYAAATTGSAVWAVAARVTGTSGDLTTAASVVTDINGFATDAVSNEKNLSTVPWTASLPAANDWLQCRISRSPGHASDTLAVDANVLSVAVAF